MKQSRQSFYDDVWEVVRLIPKGRVTTYGAIAEYLGTKGSARMVGYAMNNCPPDVPAQRVVNRIGMLTGKHHFPSGRTMELLLKKEGITVKKDIIVDFDKHFWHPRELDEML